MSEADAKKIPDLEELSDILLVHNKKRMKIEAVTGIDEKGQLKTVAPSKRNQNQFMRVDKSGDLFSNFFSNFFSQLKNPTQFSFFKVPAAEAEAKAKELQQKVDHPTKESTSPLDITEVQLPKTDTTEITQNTTKMEAKEPTTSNNEYRYKPEQIDWDTMSNLGLSKERLEKLNILEPLLKGYKTNDLISISLNFEGAITKLDARLSLQQNEEGKVTMAIHGIRKEPQLHFPFFGHQFTEQDKKNLLTTGNMGRVVELQNFKTGEPIPSIISVDRLTNELIALKTQYIKIPDELKGVQLNDQQKQTLLGGKPLYIEGMISTKGDPFNATVQFNADKRYVEFLFDRTQHKRQTQTETQIRSKSQNQSPTSVAEAPQVFRGKELDHEQYSKFKAGETVYISGLTDSKGKEYQGYITFNQETAKTEFSFTNPTQLREKAKPSEDHKTQTAVNTDGKTNEATKNIKEPLQSKQKEPVNKQQEDQQKKTTRSKGRRV
ncbi:DUF3945 domain-containing protein [Chryseobacterium wangxinyae]|uniref:DUF3945 domain-containing protein n=1 Tax=Chryseobacterium sp. CY350 TaxID=2997336 RepID=UPI00226D4135|nr:DUF3945 domain-containing protein [Chryseobacterium sp. CY350]MCY0976942.1 DUF3945 domain-containing protein [Chryseobacterium sp. CY350]WBZ96942.1 DUF3945 domain-containing protein [Chryseobacterium sp. CY350]